MGPHTCMDLPHVYGTSDLPHTCMGYPICIWDAPYAYGAKYAYTEIAIPAASSRNFLQCDFEINLSKRFIILYSAVNDDGKLWCRTLSSMVS